MRAFSLRLLVLAAGLMVRCTQGILYAEEATPDKIKIAERWITYEEAMPILLEQLKGDYEQRTRAVETLQWYGTALVDTPAIDRLLAIVDEPVDFSVFDQIMRPYIEGKSELPQELTSKERELAEKSDVKLQALMALVMSGAKPGLERLQQLLTSKSATEQFIARQVKEEQEKFGFWTKGKVPQRKPPPPVVVGTKRFEQSAAVKGIHQELDSGERKRVLNALNALMIYGYAMVADDPKAADVFTKALVSTRESAKTDADMRKARRRFARQLLTSSDGLPPERVKAILPFVEAASQDSDRYIAEAAAPVLQFFRTKPLPAK